MLREIPESEVPVQRRITDFVPGFYPRFTYRYVPLAGGVLRRVPVIDDGGVLEYE